VTVEYQSNRQDIPPPQDLQDQLSPLSQCGTNGGFTQEKGGTIYCRHESKLIVESFCQDVYRMKVLLVDDNALFLEGLQNLLESSGIDVSGVAHNAREAIAQAALLQPDVVLMDVQMPAESGIVATEALKSRFPQLKIVMMTVSESDAHLFDAVAAGASGYLLKGMPSSDFVDKLRSITLGESPFTPGLATKVLEEFSRRAKQMQETDTKKVNFSLLSDRQIEILRMVAQGLPYKEIAENLAISKATVHYHMAEITNRLHLENRSQVIAVSQSLLTARDGSNL